MSTILMITNPAPSPHLWVAGALGVALAATLAIATLTIDQRYQQQIRDIIRDGAAATSGTTAQLLVNVLDSDIQSYLSKGRSSGQARTVLSDAQYQNLDGLMRRLKQGTDIVKVKLYRVDGFVLYSTDPEQLGEDESGEPAFRSALQGIPYSYAESEDEGISAAMGREQIASYLPLRDARGAVIGVAEIYIDRAQATLAARERTRDIRALILLFGVISLILIAALSWALWLGASKRAAESTPAV